MLASHKLHPRITLDHAKALLEERGWTVSAASWEDEGSVFAFSRESVPGTYGDAAACVSWQAGWLRLPASPSLTFQYV